MRELTFQRDQVIFREGEVQSTMFEIRRGTVGIFARYGEPDERKLTELGPGQYFGEMGMVEGYPRSASAVALSDDTEVREITAREFGSFIGERPEQVLDILRALSGRVRGLTEDYRELCGVILELERAEK